VTYDDTVTQAFVDDQPDHLAVDNCFVVAVFTIVADLQV
jgi:hypothetical protein